MAMLGPGLAPAGPISTRWAAKDSDQEPWDDERGTPRNEMSPEAFMEELCAEAGGYSRFFWTLLLHYVGWWAGIVAVPAFFLDHHRCEAKLPYLAWLLYACTVLAMMGMAVLLELSAVQRLGLLRPGQLNLLWSDPLWQVPLLSTVLWKLDSYTDVAFIFIARDCGSSLWWASLATFVFGVVFGQLLFNTCFACTDCDRELPRSFGFVLLDFKLVNAAVRQAVPFDPDGLEHLPVGRPVTLRVAAELIGLEKVVGDIAQVCIQSLFLQSAKAPGAFVYLSLTFGILHGSLTLFLTTRECLADGWAAHARGVQMSTALMPTPPPAQLEPLGGDSALDSRRGSDACEESGTSASIASQAARRSRGPAPVELGRRNGAGADGSDEEDGDDFGGGAGAARRGAGARGGSAAGARTPVRGAAPSLASSASDDRGLRSSGGRPGGGAADLVDLL